jgi:hypothetical protein
MKIREAQWRAGHNGRTPSVTKRFNLQFSVSIQKNEMEYNRPIIFRFQTKINKRVGGGEKKNKSVAVC